MTAFLGRVDDVINVAGHRLGTKELESASITVEEIAEAAVVPVADDLRGRVPDMYVSLKPGITPNQAVEQKVVRAIETIIGPIARPKHVYIVPDMPRALRQDYAPSSGIDFQYDEHRRCHYPGQPGSGGGDPQDGAGRRRGGHQRRSGRPEKLWRGTIARTVVVALDGQQKRQFQQHLSQWYRRYGRDLPWRRTTDPYAILVSEMMLQQRRWSVYWNTTGVF